MKKSDVRRSPNRKAKDRPEPAKMGTLVRETTHLWRRYHLTYDQAIQVAKHVRARLELERPDVRPTTVERLTRDEERRLLARAYRARGVRGLMVKTLLLSGLRVSEFVNL